MTFKKAIKVSYSYLVIYWSTNNPSLYELLNSAIPSFFIFNSILGGEHVISFDSIASNLLMIVAPSWFNYSLSVSDSSTNEKLVAIGYSLTRVLPYSISFSCSLLLGIIIVNLNSEPLSRVELTLISPPSCSQMFLQMDRPTPLLIYFEGLLRSFWAGLNTLANYYIVIPGP